MRFIFFCLGSFLLSSTVSATPVNTIDNTSMFVDFTASNFFDGAFAVDVDGLEFDLSTASGYTLTGLLRVRTVQSLDENGLGASGFSPQPTPFPFELPLFVDLTETTLTCTLLQGSCGGFEINYALRLSLDMAEEIISAGAAIDGLGPAGFDLDFASGVSVYNDDLSQIAEISGMNVIPVPTSGVIDFQGFRGILSVADAKSIEFSSRLQSSTGLGAGESLVLPNSFTTVLAAVPEAGTLWMLFGGVAALAWLRKRKQN